jgi:hypothetical protein
VCEREREKEREKRRLLNSLSKRRGLMVYSARDIRVTRIMLVPLRAHTPTLPSRGYPHFSQDYAEFYMQLKA